MRYLTKITALLLCLPLFAFAGSYTDIAEVVSVEDIYHNHTISTPYQDCYVRRVNEQIKGDGSITNELLGGLLGGVIGNQFGGGDGKTAMTAAGALLGASIANDSEKHYRTVDKQVCETKYNYNTEKRFSHYLIKYKYNGNLYSYTSNGNKPSNNIQVRINISPI